MLGIWDGKHNIYTIKNYDPGLDNTTLNPSVDRGYSLEQLISHVLFTVWYMKVLGPIHERCLLFVEIARVLLLRLAVLCCVGGRFKQMCGCILHRNHSIFSKTIQSIILIIKNDS